jgi:hypothetical protein
VSAVLRQRDCQLVCQRASAAVAGPVVAWRTHAGVHAGTATGLCRDAVHHHSSNSSARGLGVCVRTAGCHASAGARTPRRCRGHRACILARR